MTFKIISYFIIIATKYLFFILFLILIIKKYYPKIDPGETLQNFKVIGPFIIQKLSETKL